MHVSYAIRIISLQSLFLIMENFLANKNENEKELYEQYILKKRNNLLIM